METVTAFDKAALDELLASTRGKKVAREKQIAPLKESLVQAEEQLRRLVFAEQVLAGVYEWHTIRDPGKDGPAYSFLNNSRGPVVVRELLTPVEQKKQRSLVSFEDILKRECPRCQTLLPVIREYQQTFDSPDGDEWRKRYFVVCIPCDGAREVFKDETSDYRF